MDSGARSITDNVNTLRDLLQEAPSNALERFAANLVEAASGLPVRRAASGAQSGADAGAVAVLRTIRVEAKRYRDTTRLSERELLGEVAQAFENDPWLDVWILVATREVPEQIVAALRNYGANHGAPVLILDWAGSLPTLAQLCAACPAQLQATHGQQAAAAAKALANQTDVVPAFENLRRDLREWSAGWALTSTRCRTVIREVALNRSESKAHFRQDLSIAAADSAFVQRAAVSCEFDNWCVNSEPGQPLVVIGEEGRGKSWMLANWLFHRPDDGTAVVYCSSSELRSLAEYSVEAVLSHALSKRAGPLGFEYWSKRVQRLKEVPKPSHPLIWLVIDGLNETASADWRELFLHAQRDVWKPRLRLVASCRTRYFSEDLRRGLSWTPSPVVVDVPPFTPEQRDDAFRALGIDVVGLSGSVLELALVPRICRLVALTAERLQGVEQVTFERLLFEYGKRFDPDARSNLSNEVWHAFLRELARSARDGVSTAQSSQVRRWIGVQERKAVETALGDIVDGRLVRHAQDEPGIIEFDRNLVLVANGLALWRLVEKSKLQNQSVVAELLARELEPLGGVDERPRIVAAAIAAAAISSRAPEEIRQQVAALVVEGVTSQNPESSEERSLLSFVKSFPAGFLDALSALARANRSDEAGVLCQAVQSAAEVPHVQPAVGEAASEWIRIVALSLGDEAQRPEPQRTRTMLLMRWLGRIPEIGALDVLGVRFTIEADNGHHNLPVWAVQLIQACPLAAFRMFWQGLGIASVIGDSYSLTWYAKWIVRLNNRDYDTTCELLKSVASQFVEQEPPGGADESLSRRVAAMLLWLVGEDSFDRRARELVPEPDGWSIWKNELNAPPNDSAFSLRRCHVAQVLETSTQDVRQLIGRASPWWPDPDIPISEKFIERVVEYADGFDLAEVRSGRYRTAGDHHLQVLLPALARCSATALSRFARRLVHELRGRSGDGWAFLAGDLADLWLIASTADSASARRELAREDIGECGDIQRKHARLVLRLLANARDDSEQYPRDLIAEDVNIMTETAAAALKTMTEDTAGRLLDHVRGIDSQSGAWIFVSIFTHTNTPISEAAARYLLQLTQSPLEGTRLHALCALSRAAHQAVAAEFAATGWSWRNVESDAERRHGSNILLAADPPLPISDVLTRVAPWRLPAAAHLRGSPEESRIIARTVTGLLSSKDEPIRHPFDERVVVDPSSFSAPLASLELVESDSPASPEKLEHAFDIDTRFRELCETERKVLRHIASERGGIRAFYGEWIDTDHIATLVDAEPKEVNNWLADLHTGGTTLKFKIRNAPGFYISLCELLLKRDPEIGVTLWYAIRRTPVLTMFTGPAGLDALLVVALSAPESEPAMHLWNRLWDIPHTVDDLALFNIVLAAEIADRRDWLDARIAKDASSDRPWRRDRAGYGSALRVTPDLDKGILDRPFGLRTHSERVEDRIAPIAARSLWQRHWLRRYFTAASPDEAFAALTLFLEVADRRWKLVMRDLRREDVVFPDDRAQHLWMRRSDIDSASKKFDDDLREKFLGERVARDLWPWSSTCQW